MADPTMSAKCVAEFVGTFLLVFTVGCNVLTSNAVWGGVSIGSVLMVSIYSLGGISGANFNPAVSLALGIIKAMKAPAGLDWKDVGIYMGVQIIAGITASACYYGLFLDSFALGPAKGFNGFQAALCEMLYTFMLCFVILNVCCAEKTGNSPNQFFGLAIGFVIVAGAYGAGAVSGGCFNPAVAIAIQSSNLLLLGFPWFLVYIASEFCGAALAAVLFRIVRPEEFGGEKNAVTPLVSEFLGTFMLVLTVGLNVLGKSPAGAFSIAASLMCMIYALGNVSGGHFNPAVTIAVFVSGRDDKLDTAKMAQYVSVQLSAGILAAFTYSFIHNGSTFPLGPGPKFGWVEAAVAELVFTFVLCYVVLCVAVSGKTKSDVAFGLAIGSCVTVGGNAIGAISGGSLNPAVSFGISVSHLLQGGGIVSALGYTLFEIMGGLMATGVFMVTHREEKSMTYSDVEKLS